jgi:hypothetical protein
VYRNRRRIRETRGKRLLRQRGERLERPCAHLYETSRMRRAHLRGHDNIRKHCWCMPVADLGLLMRTLFGRGHATKPPGPRGGALCYALVAPVASRTVSMLIVGRDESPIASIDLYRRHHLRGVTITLEKAFSTGC